MKKGWALVSRLFGMLLSLAALAALFLSLIVAQPQPSDPEETATEAPVSPSPAQRISSEAELRDLVAGFPAPVMSFMSGSGMSFVSGQAEDVSFSGGICRRLSLYWQTAEGVPLILQSLSPSSALEVMGKGDYAFSASPGPVLFGRASVQMENRENIRIHVQEAGAGLYVLTLPRSLSGSLSGICRSIQLFTAD